MHKFLNFLSKPSRESCYTRQEVRYLRDTAADEFPDETIWTKLKYGGAMTLPVHILPLVIPLPPEVRGPIDFLYQAIRDDGVWDGYFHEGNVHEHRQLHLWVATLGFGRYLPIGETVFVAEKRRAEMHLGGGFVSKWWMVYTWLRPAYRNQRIFLSSLDYFRHWHPHFVARESSPFLVKAFKEHPEHLPDEKKPLKWI